MQNRYVSLCIVAFLVVRPASANEPRDWVSKELPKLVELYQHFHRNPELSFEEQETAARVAAEWKTAGYDVTTGVGGHGVVAILKNGGGPTLMLRTDLDALPVTEETRLVYASTKKVKNKLGPEPGLEVGVMHACGHDIHITNLIGVARYMAANKYRWRGTLMLIGQPAEERGNGAKKMLDDGLFKRFAKPDFALALHCDPHLATGKVAHRAGYALANVDSIDIVVRGRGGHGASPHTTIDPVVQAAHLIVDLQSIVAREIRPTDPAVITVGSIHGGTKHNIIGDECHLQLTVRSYADNVRQHLLSAIKRKALAAAQSAGAPEPRITISDGTPAMFNDEKLVSRVVPVFERVLGKDNVIAAEAQMGGEDFSYYGLAGVPIFMYRLGTVDPKRLASFKQRGLEPPSLHSAVYYPDAEETLATGVITMTNAAMDLLKR
jgi:hippurate hydrolase